MGTLVHVLNQSFFNVQPNANVMNASAYMFYASNILNVPDGYIMCGAAYFHIMNVI